MNTDSWIIVTDDRRISGMASAARGLGGHVTAAVIGARALADIAAAAGFDTVRWYAVADATPIEAYAAQVAADIAAAAPRVVLASDAAPGRVVLGAAAARLDAAIIAAIRGLSFAGDDLQVRRSAAEGRIIETFAVNGPLAGIYDGEDAEPAATRPAALQPIDTTAPLAALRVVGTVQNETDGNGLSAAARVIGVGLGVRARDDLAAIEQLAAAAHAEIACSLPVCDDMRWFDASRVVGSTHNQIAPDLYIALGISGQPQHLAGVRDAKVVVAVNNDPDARIFKNCDIGIVGDLYPIVPALTAALKAAR
ncbi:electron transfer flavoprotein subunit alpha/FixB family protein [Martelella alba]|uniref:Electron transfer flavoprotein subunit alpha/FixB family protein n=1 Tax=Martelella alba TaxID=2590451 RepID=A0ABY2SGQ6_9HYPH|nr:FAD-binding protein [Martelella alba]TKI04103.1 electron transfer flavoprotein subunit alpha/FixB family protein [Martelella alba]